MEDADLVAALKQAIEGSGQSLYRIAKESGVSHPQLSRFIRGERTLTLEVASKLFTHFGLKVQTSTPPSDPAEAPEAPARPRGKRK